MNIAVIPARGGSKGLPGKNIRLLNGKPLIAYSIEVAKCCSSIGQVIVSTDDPQIEKTSLEAGADLVLKRPVNLADDHTPLFPVIKHTVEQLEKDFHTHIDSVLTMQVTNPFRKIKDLDEAYDYLNSGRYDSIVSLNAANEHPYRMRKKTGEDEFGFLASQNEVYAQRQDLPEMFSFNGTIFLNKREVFDHYHHFESGRIKYMILDKLSGIDIDDLFDFNFAEFVMERGYYEV